MASVAAVAACSDPVPGDPVVHVHKSSRSTWPASEASVRFFGPDGVELPAVDTWPEYEAEMPRGGHLVVHSDFSSSPTAQDRRWCTILGVEGGDAYVVGDDTVQLPAPCSAIEATGVVVGADAITWDDPGVGVDARLVRAYDPSTPGPYWRRTRIVVEGSAATSAPRDPDRLPMASVTLLACGGLAWDDLRTSIPLPGC